MKDQTNGKISVTEENNRSDQDSDHKNGDENIDGECRKKIGKGQQSKNLEAERKRRKKLNDRLYSLRALVPNISKLDRGAILGDAINYVKELEKQVKDLQIELEEDSDDENAMKIVRNSTDNKVPPLTLHQNGTKSGPKREKWKFFGDFHKDPKEKVHQMEVLCEHKHGGFVRLIEGLSYLGFQVINVNATRHKCLVSIIFRVERRDKETVQADHVKESLLEVARNQFKSTV
ncbi:hypothetical protein DH2020_029653 [Rehmannia glutinosa]|uniref:BHLH domain-containing protein n=1 Tax=Rehmannia glutinosa TaxID=99300 RepID=A0ABR0VQK8_REHGL